MRTLLLFAMLVSCAAVAGEVYRWVDESGQVHYSDMPHEGAERVILGTAQTFTAPAPRRSGGRRQRPSAGLAGSYESLVITSPAEEEVLWNIEGNLAVSLQIRPLLKRGHRLRLIFDGSPVGDVQLREDTVQLTDVYRGRHTLAAEIVDAQGSPLIRTDLRTFMVRQTSIANPRNPVRKRRAAAGLR